MCALQRRLPEHGNVLVAAGSLDQMPAGREREVIALTSILSAAARSNSFLRVATAARRRCRRPPAIRMAREHQRVVGGVAENHDRLVARWMANTVWPGVWPGAGSV